MHPLVLEMYKKHLEAARNEVSLLACGKRNGGRDFQMSVPTRDSDSDMILCAALDDLEALLKASEKVVRPGTVVLRVPEGVSVDVAYHGATNA